MTSTTQSKPARKIDPEKIDTYYAGWVQCIKADGERGCSTGIHGNTIPELIADAFKTAAYYIGIGYRVEIRGLARYCSKCHGAGRIHVKQFKSKTCPECKGIGELQTFDPIAINAPESTTIRDAAYVDA